ncbi:50S ribosomal protein L29 [Dokdonella sp.]|uniref:50S ribosomal protein L29 n=1 Tax=Dokdonella sp. TaxID=2291710 RepID=UPI0031C15B51|nr:50S ribosomal protein L29 [Dokdonella sp.]
MKLNELRQKNARELEDHLLELRREQFNLRMQRGSGQMAQTHQFGRVRREIAQVKHLLGTKKQESQQ